jgi:hypothetical protein
MRLAVTAALGLSIVTSNSAAAQSPYELRLGMYDHMVQKLVGGKILKKTAEVSAESDETWEGDDFFVYFCKKRVTAISIDLVSGVESWNRAVDAEAETRGEPTIKRKASVGVIDAIWRTSTGGDLTITLQDLRGLVSVTRWSSTRANCAAMTK